MKPNTDSMQKHALETTVEVKDYNNSPSRSKSATFGFGAIAVLLVISTVITAITFIQVMSVKDQLASLSDEAKMNLRPMAAEDSELTSQEDIVEANITYHLPLSNETIEQKVVVTNNEEEITTPEKRTIYDYDRGYVVTRFENDGNGRSADICYVRKFTPREDTSIIKAVVKTEKRDVVVASETTTESYTSTGEPFDRDLLSERASAMCENSDVIFMSKSDEASPGTNEGESAIRKKRSGCLVTDRCEKECFAEIREIEFVPQDECPVASVTLVSESCRETCYCLV